MGKGMALTIPAKLTAGDTWIFTFSHADYSAQAWTASIFFKNAAVTFTATSTDSGSDHAFAIDAATTATKAAGRYQWSVRVTDGADSHTVETGWVEVLADPAAAGAYDARSWARQTLDAVEAFLLGNATTAQQAMTIAGRSISRWSLAELNQWRTQLRQEVRTEESGESAGLGRNIKVRYRSV
jgi:hypothetical protein